MVPPPTPQKTGYVTQFLSSALSQRGPDALPYTEDTKWLIRQHLVSLVEAFPSLIPKASRFNHDDGSAVHLLHAEGTIPIVFGGIVYNIPATIWLPETYPRVAPLPFVTPTPDMVVKPNHPNVDRSGRVTVPYMRSWVFPSSNLVDLVQSLSRIFSQDPPLYTRHQPPPSTSAAPNTNNNANPSTSQSMSRPPTSSASASSTHSMSPYGGRLPPSPQHHRTSEDPSVVFRRNAVNKIVETIHADMVDLRKKTHAEMEKLFAEQAKLKQNENILAQGVGGMNEELEGLEQHLQVVLMSTEVLVAWVRENEGKMAGWKDGNCTVDVDDIFETPDVLSKQLLECTSADMALEDTVYALDKALQEDSIPFEKYMKSIRALSREQFFHRVTLGKVRAAQVQTHLSNMASRVKPWADN